MKRIIFFILIFFLTFAASVALTKVYFVLNLQFVEKGVGSFGMCGDGFGGFTVLESYDGEKLTFSNAKFSTEQSAQQCVQIRLQEAIRLTEREVLFDKTGEKIVGERIIAIFPPNEFVKTEWASIVSLDENQIYEIASTSLRHATIYESRMRKY